MRLQFINPIYLPSLNEQFLRKDFNFAEYLSYAYGKTLRLFFNTSWLTLIVFLLIFNVFKIVYPFNTSVPKPIDFDDFMTILPYFLNLIPPALIFLLFFGLLTHFTKIERKLYPQMQN